MGNCCKSEEGQEAKEIDDYNQNNNEDIFKTRAPCLYGHYCPCPCHKQGSDRGGVCLFKLKAI